MENLNLRPFLEDVEARIDAAQEQRLAKEWEAFCDLRCTAPFFSPRRVPAESSIFWPSMCINEAFSDPDKMIYTQLKGVSDLLAGETGLLLNVRANYGTGIIPTMFGAELFFLPDEADTLPGTRPLPGGMEALNAIVAAGKADDTQGLAPAVFTFGRRWRELTEDFPKLRKYVYLYNPDLQGPFSLADMLAGGDIYYAIYDDPELVHDALRFLTDIYLDFTRRWQAEFPPYDDAHTVEWGLLHKGRIILRNDAITNISDAMYREFVMSYDQRCFREMGGGMHFCGRGDHYIGSACALENLSCINLSQPELNDMEKIYQASVDCGKLIIGMPPPEIHRAMSAGRALHGLVQSGAAVAAYRDEQEA